MFLANRVVVPLSKRGLRQGLRATQMTNTRIAYFSEEVKEEAKPAAAEPSAAEVEAGRQEWGIKYDDECLKFEKEWQEIAQRVQDENMVYLEAELSDLQKKKVEMLADKVLDMNIFETRYFHAVIA